METADNWHSHIHKTLCEHVDIKILWNQGVGSGKLARHNN